MSFILTVIVNGYPTKLAIQQDAMDRFIEDATRARSSDWISVNQTDGTKAIMTLAGRIDGVVIEDAS